MHFMHYMHSIFDTRLINKQTYHFYIQIFPISSVSCKKIERRVNEPFEKFIYRVSQETCDFCLQLVGGKSKVVSVDS